MKKLKQKGLIVLFIAAFILGILSCFQNPPKPKEVLPYGWSLI